MAAIPAVPPLAMAAMALASGGLKAYSQYSAGKVANQESKVAAEREKIASKDRQIMRNEELLRSMAARNASTGSRGITGASITAASTEDIRQTELATMSDRATTAGRVATLRARGKNAKIQGTIGAAASLLDAVNTAARIGKPPSEKSEGP